MEERKVFFKQKLNTYNSKVNIVNGIFAIVAINLVNPYFSKFALRLGASDYQIGLLSSLPALFSVLTLIMGAVIIEGSTNKKKTTSLIMFSHKAFYLLLAVVPFMPENYQSWVFVILVGIMNLPGSISITGFQSSIGDIFDERARGRAMGLRNRYSAIFGMIVAFTSGRLLTIIPNNNSETIILYQVFFIIAFIFAQGEVLSYLKFRGIRKVKQEKNAGYLKSLKVVLKNLPKQRKFIIFTCCSLLFHFGWQMGWPLFSLYTIDYLNADETWLGIISVASSLSSILTYTLWGKLADKYGNSIMLGISTFGMAITPILYAASNSLIALVLFNVIIGVSVAGTVLILFNILLEVIPSQNRTIYIAIYNTLINLSATISPIIGVRLKKDFNIYLALIIVGILRLIGSASFFLRNKFIKKAK
ncbi:MFS transporter [Dethiothermospora halolimnae]|uniref:MFS transporter n=1 Tax=Dethiothermospora halolimnae TaxID=3114390 RepID=UPI003CCBADAE